MYMSERRVYSVWILITSVGAIILITRYCSSGIAEVWTIVTTVWIWRRLCCNDLLENYRKPEKHQNTEKTSFCSQDRRGLVTYILVCVSFVEVGIVIGLFRGMDPHHARRLHRDGIELYKRNAYRAALPLLSEASNRDHGNLQYHYDLAICYQKMGKWLEAAREYRECLQIDPTNEYSLYNLGVVSGALGNLDEELKSYLRVVQRNETNADAHYSLGLYYLRDARTDESRAEFQRAAGYYPKGSSGRTKAEEMVRILDDPIRRQAIQGVLH